MKHPAFMGGMGLALVFGGGIIALPALVFLLAAAAGPVFVFGIGGYLVWLAGKDTKKLPVRQYRTRLMPRPRNGIRPFERVTG